MITSVYIVDDEPHAVELLTGYVARTPGLRLLGSSTHPVEALDRILNADPPALTFLDVDMPALSGIELARRVAFHTRVVFTTSFREYGAEAYEYDVLDYLLKPFSYERFLAAIRKYNASPDAEAGKASEGLEAVFVKTDTKGKLLRVRLDTLLYVEGAQNYIKIHLVNGETILTNLSIRELMHRLPAGRFLRIHKSYVVNLRAICSIEAGQLRLDNEAMIPIGRAYQELLLTQLGRSILNGGPQP